MGRIFEGADVRGGATRGIVVRKSWLRHLLTFLVVAGPGLIVMEADNDAGAVSTYTQAGAQYGLHLLWVMLLLLPVCYCCQEMVARLGIATGEGHAATIYKRFGKWWGRFSLFDLIVVNFCTIVTEFAGISLVASRFGVPPLIAVPLFAAALVGVVITASYRRWEGVMVVLCLLDAVWLWAAFHTSHAIGPIISNTLVPNLPPAPGKAFTNIPAGGVTGALVFLVMGVIGTTIAPWQLFFQQSCVADKRLRFSDLRWERLDTFLSSIFTIVVGGCMMIVGAVAYRHNIAFIDPGQMADAIAPFAGPTIRNLVLIMLCNAAVLGASAVSLASAWAWAEVTGWPHSLQQTWSQAKGFYSVYAVGVGVAAAIVLIPKAPLQLIIVGVQVLASLVLPVALVFLQLLLNDRALLGDKWVNKPFNNFINWAIIITLFAMSLILAVQTLWPNLPIFNFQ